MQQIIIVWWWDVYENYDMYLEHLKKRHISPFEKAPWTQSRRHNFPSFFPEDSFQVMVPEMPCKWFADYKAWKIWFERHCEYITDPKPIFIGWSLGTTFLLKYLTEENSRVLPDQLHLVSPYVTNSSPGEILGSFEFDLHKTSELQDLIASISIYHSRDDKSVPYSDCEVLHSHIPKATLYTFEDRWHFYGPTFLELVENIIKLSH